MVNYRVVKIHTRCGFGYRTGAVVEQPKKG